MFLSVRHTCNYIKAMRMFRVSLQCPVGAAAVLQVADINKGTFTQLSASNVSLSV